MVIALEKQGYSFIRTEQNRRLFIEHDITALNSLQELIQVQKMTLENASIIVASRFANLRSSTGTPSVLKAKYKMVNNETIIQLNKHIQSQEKFNQKLLERLDQQNEYINQQIKERDKLLMHSLNEIVKGQKQINMEKKGEKEGLFKKIFKKI